MGRPRILEEAKMVPVMLDRRTREIVEKGKGDLGVSGFIRDSIQMRDPKFDGTSSRKEMQELKEKNVKMAHELERYKQRDQTITQEKEQTMAYIMKGLELYKAEDPIRSENPEICRQWIFARCKDSGVTPAEFSAFAELYQ